MPEPGLPKSGASDLPDIAWMTRLANEMFRTLSDNPSPSAPLPVGGFGLTPPSTPLPDMPAPAITAPGEGELRTLLAGGPAAPVPSPSAPLPVGGFGVAPPSTPLPGVPNLGTSIPGEAELRALLGGTQGAPVPLPQAPLAGATPPMAFGGFGVAPPSTPLPEVPTLGTSLPGEAELRVLLGPALGLPVPGAPPQALPASPTAPSFYFLEEAGHGVPAVGARPDAAPGPNFDANARRSDFPILAERVNGRPLIWLDNGATTQKPRAVIDRLVYYYEHENSNIHRAAHESGGAGDRCL